MWMILSSRLRICSLFGRVVCCNELNCKSVCELSKDGLLYRSYQWVEGMNRVLLAHTTTR